MNNYFGYNLRYLRKCYNLTQEQLAKISGKSYRAVSRWESGIHEPSDAVVQKFADHFGLAPADLMYKPLDAAIDPDEQSDLFRLLSLVEKMDDKQFACLLAYAEGLVHASI